MVGDDGRTEAKTFNITQAVEYSAAGVDEKGGGIMKITIRKAREVMIKAFRDDPDFRQTYVDNIACCIMDNTPGFKKNKQKRDKLAEKIMDTIFSEC